VAPINPSTPFPEKMRGSTPPIAPVGRDEDLVPAAPVRRPRTPARDVEARRRVLRRGRDMSTAVVGSVRVDVEYVVDLWTFEISVHQWIG